MKNLPKREKLNPDSTYLANIIEEREEKLMEMRVQEWVYQREYADPKNISKTKAQENLTIFQKRIRYYEEEIELYWQFIEDKKIQL